MGFIEAIKVCFSKFFTISGRARRAEFWWFYLFTFLISIIPVIGTIASLVLLIPNTTVTVRRLHDIGRSGWWILGFYGIIAGLFAVGFGLAEVVGEAAVGIVVVIGSFATLIVAIIWLVRKGDDGPNRYGDDPCGGVSADVFA